MRVKHIGLAGCALAGLAALFATGAGVSAQVEALPGSPERSWNYEPDLPPSDDPLVRAARSFFSPLPLEVADIEGLEVTPAQIELGKLLFFDPRLSDDGTVSCASCHDIFAGGADTSAFSIGVDGQQGGRNAPSVFNSLFNFSQFWDGRAHDLVDQAGGPILNPVEMAATQEAVTARLGTSPAYTRLFTAAFPQDPAPVSFVNVQTAIAAFEATLLTPNAPFDRFLRGEVDALDADQKEGMVRFVEIGCTICHSGVNVGGAMYQRFGLMSDPGSTHLPVEDRGRSAVTGKSSDDYNFKVPSLRNITLTAPYFHTGSEDELGAAIDVMATNQLDQLLFPDDIEKILAFLESLQGERPDIGAPQLPADMTVEP